MNKWTILIVAVVIVLLLGLGGFMMMQKKPAPGMEQTAPTSPSQTQSVSNKKTLRDLLSLGQPQKCTYTISTQTSNSTGTVYVSGKDMRSDVSMDIQGKSTLSHIILTGGTSYVWVDGQTNGIKMSVNPEATPVPTVTGAPSQVDLDSQVDYNCSPWVVDSSLFNLPVGVKFSDISQMLAVPTGAAVSGVPAGKNCSACNYLSGKAKTQCLTALGCN